MPKPPDSSERTNEAAPVPEYYAHGKLLLTGEYVVLDGALALAVPTRFGQWLRLHHLPYPWVVWESRLRDETTWFKATMYDPKRPFLRDGTNAQLTERMNSIIEVVNELQPDFFSQWDHTRVETKLEFPRDWGLGSSSTLVALIAAWTGVNAYRLLERTFGGSGYDLACAVAKGPIFYQNRPHPTTEPAAFDPSFRDQLYFIHLEEKQNSREGIARYRNRAADGPPTQLIEEINTLSRSFVNAHQLTELERVMNAHETLIGNFLQLQPVKLERFDDYWGAIKSLGAWGGDFVLATSVRSAAETRGYFNEKGYSTVISYADMVL